MVCSPNYVLSHVRVECLSVVTGGWGNMCHCMPRRGGREGYRVSPKSRFITFPPESGREQAERKKFTSLFFCRF